MIATLALLSLVFADLAGHWQGPMGELDLRHKGDTVSGELLIGDGTLQIEGAAETEGRVSLSLVRSAAGRLHRVVVSGSIVNDRLKILLGSLELVLDRVPEPANSARVKRVADLMRLWGTVKLFHPWVASRDINWDSALTDAIPKAEAAVSDAEFADSVQFMLARLNDPETLVLNGPAPQPAPQPGKQRRLVRRGLPPQVPEWPTPEYYEDWEVTDSAPPFVIDLPAVRVLMRTGEPATGKAPEIRAEKTDSDELPSRERRLLALARYWSAIRYFYGYHDFIPDWESVLEASIPDFEAARTRHDYLFALGHLAYATHDGHSYIPELRTEMGRPPNISVRTAESQLVVQDVGSGEQHTVQRGDIVLTINGEPAQAVTSRLMNLLAHSTEPDGRKGSDSLALAGPERAVKLTIQKQDGSQANVTLNRTGPPPIAPRPKYRVLPEGFGYIDIGHIPAEEMDAAMAAVAGSKGLILDLRGYPPDTSIASRLAGKRVAAARNVFRVWHGPDPALSEMRVETEIITPRPTPQYTGPVVVLIDREAGSRPEWTCMELEAAVHPTFIGGRTSGVIGTVTNMVLPGSVQVNFSTSEQRHADGAPLQRVGIIPDIAVEPTIEGIRQGRDEILDRAVLFLKSGN